MKDDQNEVERLMEIVTAELKDHERRITAVETDQANLKTRTAVVENDVKYVKDDLKAIRDNTTWLLRIVIGAIVLALLGVVLVKSAPTAKASTIETVGGVVYGER